ncbi:DUF3833 domain-containing protein [Pelomonas aquatica]|jgi:hypothetical protein|uniref:DUF3833 domain-containing protein n=1 Tax=Pelomonas aquatica TaxID=431058 RepID=A0A9X4LES1_9BURK|nr:DUF3833 domain-containing protein [Pelomonas aquatica]MCY4752958.1 DUF3833 domain-containing protein [Pelomonas aquatica]MDG0862102.1 DUF3833 domain-containing protein [Pelomonas aquatica]
MKALAMKHLARRNLIIATVAATLAGCAGPRVQDYAKEEPRLDLRAFLTGDLTAKGMFTDRSGRVVKRFTVRMNGRWDGDSGVLDEHFQYSDGSTQRRIWRLKALGQGRYSGRADDVVGEAAGESAGNAFRWGYTLALPVDGRVWNVALDDWMFLLDERTVLNRSAMSKFGLHVGDVTLVITRDGRG